MRATVITPSPRSVFHRIRGYFAFIAIVAAMMLVFIFALTDPPSTESYSIKNPLSQGSQAIARVTQERANLPFYEVTSAARALELMKTYSGDNPTLVLINPQYATEKVEEALSSLPRVVGFGWVSSPESKIFPKLNHHFLYRDNEISINPSTLVEDNTSSRSARLAGRVSAVDTVFIPQGSYWNGAFKEESTHSSTNEFFYVEHWDSQHYRALFASPKILTNAHIGEHGNAALVINMLTVQPEGSTQPPGPVIVLHVDSDDTFSHETLFPEFIWPATSMLFLAFVTLGLCRGRRLGGLIDEDLPSFVPASETVSGQGSLLLLNRERTYTANMLRADTARRLARRLGVDPHASRDTLELALTNAGAPPTSTQCLWTPDPATDQDLIELSQRLTALEKEIHL